MENIDRKKTLDEIDALLAENLSSPNLNNYIEDMNKILNDDKLTKLHNENHKRYHNIDILKLKQLPSIFSEKVDDILKLYDSINGMEILEADLNNSFNISKLLDSIDSRYTKLTNCIKTYLKQITSQNDEAQKKFSKAYFENLAINKSQKKYLIEKYSDLILYNSYIEQDPFFEVNRQLERQNRINEILKSINKEQLNQLKIKDINKLEVLNKDIDKLRHQYEEKFTYLDDIIPENSKYQKQYDDLKSFYYKIIAYDNQDYENTKQTYEILIDETKLKEYILECERLFIGEREDKLEKERFIYEKVGVKNLKKSIEYILSSYINDIDEFDKKVIEYANDCLNKNENIETSNKLVKAIVNKLWLKSITDVNSFNNDKDYCFICSNNQFINPRYQAILITKKEIELVDDYADYQIGFICNYNDNIMYITENVDIMSVEDYNDMSNLKTPLQLEKEFINFKICNRIALNGYITKIVGVYIINDGDMDKYVKAVELANSYNLPLIDIKK